MRSPGHRSAFSTRPHTGRFVIVWIVLILALLGGAAMASPPAAMPPLVSAPGEAEAEAAEEEFEGEGEEWEVEIEEEEEEEFEVGGSAGPTVLPPDCVLRTADPSVVATNDRLQMTLRYTSEEPSKIGVEYWLKGGKVSFQLGSVKRRLGKRGVLKLSRHLDERELAKLHAARLIMLRLDVPAVNSRCKPFLTFRLGTKQQRGSRTTWSQLLERRY